MRLKDLINKYSNFQIFDVLIALYPNTRNNLKGYTLALKEIRCLMPKKTDVSILLKELVDVESEKYIHVNGIDIDLKIWAIELTDWSEWINMEINKQTLENYKDLDILAHCLWEMTWFGYSYKEIKKQSEELRNMVEDIEEERKNG